MLVTVHVVNAQILESYLPEVTLATDAVLSRPRPEYTAPGIRAGGFVLHPELQEGVGYNSNVLGQSGGPGSPSVETSGALAAASDWSRNAVGLFVNVDNVQTPGVSELSYTNETVAIAGSLDIGRGQLRGAYTFVHANLLPNALGGLGLQRNLPFTTNDVRAGYTVQIARVAIIPDIAIDDYRYGSAYGYLNRLLYSPRVTTRYELAPDRNLVFVVRGTSAQFLSAQPSRDYFDLQFLAGLDFTANGVLRYGALLGYETRRYQNPQIAGASSPIVEGTAVWTPTRLTTLTGTVTHRIEDAVEDNIYDYTFTEVRAVMDHELRRDLLLQAYLSMQRANYAQSGGVQTLAGAGGSLAWLLSRTLQLRASAAFTEAFAQAPANYTRNVILLQLKFGL